MEKTLPSDANLILIGMPGAGKSTLGVLVAKILGMDFMDTDLVIQSREGLRLHEIIRQKGLDAFRELEARYVEGLLVSRTVIATGGSVVYSQRAMESLARTGFILYLSLSLENLLQRLGNLDERGVVRRPGQDLAALFAERIPLYEAWAHGTLVCDGLSPEACLEQLNSLLPSSLRVSEKCR
ncbi:shikimate kinase [Desulfobotulus sp.]|uniref:shikimate kinase n=1 Tax=Desulfobotulus sp. TaxID=1940337 RepID=UPI002A36D1BE|nr:shikimate kinase [Desulfobotulus sp.]MDY0163243.1 shikimate kinase [Desulfobotulus sp.]